MSNRIVELPKGYIFCAPCYGLGKKYGTYCDNCKGMGIVKQI